MNKALLLVILLPLAACQQSDRTKSWYLEHTAEREARVVECKDDAALTVTADCQNALAAKAQAGTFGTGAARSIDVTPDRARNTSAGERSSSAEMNPDHSIDVTPKRPRPSNGEADGKTH
ncbi:EexN family lipoprotein [Xanthomonas hortorum pv. pelargonii]|uniref:EexN family lipoprotein n=1 Tax=Xanthomonas hortorum pv. pelargonii TaxID=453602 RepID=A0A6V7FFH4_9XANT|nr:MULTISPECIES: EexN family lipoprotein [Xanthomonas]MCE4307381.1 EexN family lipoprotein [Xanthomonas hortorum pv. vitians]MCE4338167.1 EexN family lipoprotein [Xanthomonas hortorum pv. vitians]MCE4356168.1 EexN family lipoprotein [Xanthomonas hortorum pv. pelargonii]MCE4507747.1 EexN family lipoprotein [Xanthomonas hortorum pv. vitians]MCE4511294.1 EexN family lipoprotein [Xanthomonas hortorum pv. vitians]